MNCLHVLHMTFCTFNVYLLNKSYQCGPVNQLYGLPAPDGGKGTYRHCPWAAEKCIAHGVAKENSFDVFNNGDSVCSALFMAI